MRVRASPWTSWTLRVVSFGVSPDDEGGNPQTGDPITITERRVLNFKASQLLKLALNDEHPSGANGASDGAEG
jgi:hypothetical protein